MRPARLQRSSDLRLLSGPRSPSSYPTEARRRQARTAPGPRSSRCREQPGKRRARRVLLGGASPPVLTLGAVSPQSPGGPGGFPRVTEPEGGGRRREELRAWGLGGASAGAGAGRRGGGVGRGRGGPGRDGGRPRRRGGPCRAPRGSSRRLQPPLLTSLEKGLRPRGRQYRVNEPQPPRRPESAGAAREPRAGWRRGAAVRLVPPSRPFLSLLPAGPRARPARFLCPRPALSLLLLLRVPVLTSGAPTCHGLGCGPRAARSTSPALPPRGAEPERPRRSRAPGMGSAV